MRNLNLTNPEYFPMVHFFTMDKVIYTYSSARIVPGDTFTHNEAECIITEMKREAITPAYEDKYSVNTSFYCLKYKVAQKQ